MSLYGRYVLPRLTDLVMGRVADAEERARLVPLASGVVVEIGIGSALNLPFYGPDVERVHGVDPSVELWRIGRRRVDAARFPVEFHAGSAERLPLPTGLADTVVSTWTLCTIPDPRAALAEVRRVLKPEGSLLFVEHGRALEPSVRVWQDRLTPLWRAVAGGCHMNRAIDTLVGETGFRFARIETGYTSGARVLAYLYRGVAISPPTGSGPLRPGGGSCPR